MLTEDLVFALIYFGVERSWPGAQNPLWSRGQKQQKSPAAALVNTTNPVSKRSRIGRTCSRSPVNRSRPKASRNAESGSTRRIQKAASDGFRPRATSRQGIDAYG